MEEGELIYRLKSIENWLVNVSKKQEQTQQEVVQARIDIAALKIKAGIWGLIAGAIPALVALVWVIVRVKG